MASVDPESSNTISSQNARLARQASSGGFGADQLNVYAPYTSVMRRLLGQSYLRGITVRVSDNASMDAAQSGITALLTSRHGTVDFYLNNTD